MKLDWHTVKSALQNISTNYNKFKTKTETLNEDNQFLTNKINETERNINNLQNTLDKATQGFYQSTSNFNNTSKQEKVTNYMLGRHDD